MKSLYWITSIALSLCIPETGFTAADAPSPPPTRRQTRYEYDLALDFLPATYDEALSFSSSGAAPYATLGQPPGETTDGDEGAHMYEIILPSAQTTSHLDGFGFPIARSGKALQQESRLSAAGTGSEEELYHYIDAPSHLPSGLSWNPTVYDMTKEASALRQSGRHSSVYSFTESSGGGQSNPRIWNSDVYAGGQPLVEESSFGQGDAVYFTPVTSDPSLSSVQDLLELEQKKWRRASVDRFFSGESHFMRFLRGAWDAAVKEAWLILPGFFANQLVHREPIEDIFGGTIQVDFPGQQTLVGLAAAIPVLAGIRHAYVRSQLDADPNKAIEEILGRLRNPRTLKGDILRGLFGTTFQNLTYLLYAPDLEQETALKALDEVYYFSQSHTSFYWLASVTLLYNVANGPSSPNRDNVIDMARRTKAFEYLHKILNESQDHFLKHVCVSYLLGSLGDTSKKVQGLIVSWAIFKTLINVGAVEGTVNGLRGLAAPHSASSSESLASLNPLPPTPLATSTPVFPTPTMNDATPLPTSTLPSPSSSIPSSAVLSDSSSAASSPLPTPTPLRNASSVVSPPASSNDTSVSSETRLPFPSPSQPGSTSSSSSQSRDTTTLFLSSTNGTSLVVSSPSSSSSSLVLFLTSLLTSSSPFLSSSSSWQVNSTTASSGAAPSSQISEGTTLSLSSSNGISLVVSSPSSSSSSLAPFLTSLLTSSFFSSPASPSSSWQVTSTAVPSSTISTSSAQASSSTAIVVSSSNGISLSLSSNPFSSSSELTTFLTSLSTTSTPFVAPSPMPTPTPSSGSSATPSATPQPTLPPSQDPALQKRCFDAITQQRWNMFPPEDPDDVLGMIGRLFLPERMDVNLDWKALSVQEVAAFFAGFPQAQPNVTIGFVSLKGIIIPDDASLQTLLQALPTNITGLDLSQDLYSPIPNVLFNFTALNRFKNLSTFKASGWLGTINFDTLLPAFSTLPLKNVNLSYTGLGDTPQIARLLPVLFNISTLEEVDLSNNDISLNPADTQTLARALTHTPASLKKLYLDANAIGDNDATGVLALFTSFGNLTSLTKLSFGKNVIGTRSGAPYALTLAQALQNLTNLEELNFEGNYLSTSNNLTTLVTAIGQLPKLQRFYGARGANNAQPFSSSVIQSFRVSLARLSPNNTDIFSQLLSTDVLALPPGTTTINLSGQLITDPSVLQTVATEIAAYPGNITSMDLSGNQDLAGVGIFGPPTQFGSILPPVVAKLPLQSLSLEDNEITGAKQGGWISAIGNSSGIKSLNLRKNYFYNDGSAPFRATFNKSLKTLRLGENPYVSDSTNGETVLNILGENLPPTMAVLELDHCNIAGPGELDDINLFGGPVGGSNLDQFFQNLGSRVSNLQRLDLSHNPIRNGTRLAEALYNLGSLKSFYAQYLLLDAGSSDALLNATLFRYSNGGLDFNIAGLNISAASRTAHQAQIREIENVPLLAACGPELFAHIASTGSGNRRSLKSAGEALPALASGAPAKEPSFGVFAGSFIGNIMGFLDSLMPSWSAEAFSFPSQPGLGDDFSFRGLPLLPLPVPSEEEPRIASNSTGSDSSFLPPFFTGQQSLSVSLPPEKQPPSIDSGIDSEANISFGNHSTTFPSSGQDGSSEIPFVSPRSVHRLSPREELLLDSRANFLSGLMSQIDTGLTSALFFLNLMQFLFTPTPEDIRNYYETLVPLDLRIKNGLEKDLKEAHHYLWVLKYSGFLGRDMILETHLKSLENDFSSVFSHNEETPAGRLKSLQKSLRIFHGDLAEQAYVTYPRLSPLQKDALWAKHTLDALDEAFIKWRAQQKLAADVVSLPQLRMENFKRRLRNFEEKSDQEKDEEILHTLKADIEAFAQRFRENYDLEIPNPNLRYLYKSRPKRTLAKLEKQEKEHLMSQLKQTIDNLDETVTTLDSQHPLTIGAFHRYQMRLEGLRKKLLGFEEESNQEKRQEIFSLLKTGTESFARRLRRAYKIRVPSSILSYSYGQKI